MTHLQLTLSNLRFSFRPQVALLMGAAGIGGAILMFAYVGALRESVQRGEALRQMQRASPALAATSDESSARTTSTRGKLVVLDR